MREITSLEAPNPPSIWVRPNLPERGDHDKKDIWAAVGAAMSAWGEYETELGRLFAIFMAGDFPSPQAKRAFGAIRGFEGRKELLRAAYEAFFAYHGRHIDNPEAFKEILKQAKNAVKIRNDIAHGIVMPFTSKGKTEPNGFCLVPPYHDKNRDVNSDDPEFAYRAEDIMVFATEFGKLPKAPNEFGDSIIARIRAFRGPVPPQWNY
jgi:hypothetical protein